VGVADATAEDFEAEIDTNTRGVLLSQARDSGDARARRRRNRQHQLGIRPSFPRRAGHYGLSKAAVTHLTRSAAAEVGKQGIRVNEIAPALLMSDMVKQYFEGPNAIPL
jgi:NAD(P)-dependent dehydrogenase (short-subunit alcohol dehydrogenase family)